MKKFWLLALWLAIFTLAGCSIHVNFNKNNNDEQNDDKPSLDSDVGRLFACNEEVGKYYNITTFWGWWDIEQEAWASFVLNWNVTYEDNWETIEKHVECVVDMVDKSVSIYEFDESEIIEECVNEDWEDICIAELEE